MPYILSPNFEIAPLRSQILAQFFYIPYHQKRNSTSPYPSKIPRATLDPKLAARAHHPSGTDHGQDDHQHGGQHEVRQDPGLDSEIRGFHDAIGVPPSPLDGLFVDQLKMGNFHEQTVKLPGRVYGKSYET